MEPLGGSESHIFLYKVFHLAVLRNLLMYTVQIDEGEEGMLMKICVK